MVGYADPPDDETIFKWAEAKNRINQDKHGVSFEEARQAFTDPYRMIFAHLDHSLGEDRFFCLGCAADGILTVRFTYRNGCIRIFGAGYWRTGRRIYADGRRSLH
jgi:uncharacterized DUF497 family protein